MVDFDCSRRLDNNIIRFIPIKQETYYRLTIVVCCKEYLSNSALYIDSHVCCPDSETAHTTLHDRTMNAQQGSLSEQKHVDPTPMPSEMPHVDEVGATSAPLKSAAFFIGAYCKEFNGSFRGISMIWVSFSSFKSEDFMLCKNESRDPAHCLKEGRRVTRCVTDLWVPFFVATFLLLISIAELELQRCEKTVCSNSMHTGNVWRNGTRCAISTCRLISSLCLFLESTSRRYHMSFISASSNV